MSRCLIAGSLSWLGSSPTLAEDYWARCCGWPTTCRQAKRPPVTGPTGACPWRNHHRTLCLPPQLFIYSVCDEVCDVASLERLMAQREAAGVPIAKLCFQKSAHVMHYRTHPWLYQAAVLHHSGLVTPSSKAEGSNAETREFHDD